jgi:hypothetical protein
MTENRIFTLCRMIIWVVFLRMFWNFISSFIVKRGGSLSFLMIFTFAIPELLPISITKTLPIVPTKNERDPPLFTGRLLIKFQNILRNTTQVIIRHRVKNPIFRHIKDNLSSVSQNVLKFYQQLTGEERRVRFIFGRNNQ